MMVYIYDRCARLRGDPVELIAELRHLLRRVLVAGQYLIDRVDDNRLVAVLFRPPDKLRNKLVDAFRPPSQVPYIKLLECLAWHACGLADVLKSMQAAIPIQLKIDVQDAPLSAFPADPRPAGCDRQTELDEQEGLPCLGSADDQHLVAFPEHSRDKLRRHWRKIVDDVIDILEIGEIVIHGFDVLFPFVP